MSKSKPRWDKRTRLAARQFSASVHDALDAPYIRPVEPLDKRLPVNVASLDQASVMAIATALTHDPVSGFMKAKVVDTPKAKAKRDKRQRFSQPAKAPVTPAQYSRLEQFSHARQYFASHLNASLRLADAAEKARKEARQGWV